MTAVSGLYAEDIAVYLDSDEAGVAFEGRRLLVALPLVNRGADPALEVALTDIALCGEAPLKPDTLPFFVGDVAAADQVLLQFAFPRQAIDLKEKCRLAVRGTYRGVDGESRFIVRRAIVRPLPAAGRRVIQEVEAEPHMVDGAVYPPTDVEETIEEEPGRPPLPEGRRVGDPGPDNPSVEIAEVPPVGRVPLDATTQAVEEVSFVRVTDEPLTWDDTKGGAPWDPSGASLDVAGGPRVVFLTGNLYALLSTDGGATFTHIDPTTIFGNIPLDGMPQDEGLCCDMNLLYVPSIDRFVWLLLTKGSQIGTEHYVEDGKIKFRPIYGYNRLRVASASTQQVIASNGTSWSYWDMTTLLFGFGKTAFLDYPDLSFTHDSLHISVTRPDMTGFFVIRVPLADVQSGGVIHIGYTDPSDGASAVQARLAHDSTDAAYWFGQTTNNTVVIFEWRDGAPVYTWRSRTVSTWDSDPDHYKSTVPGGENWLAADTSAIRGATVQGDENFSSGSLRTILIAWNAGRDANFPQPYVRLLPVYRLRAFGTTLWTTGQSSQIWNPEIAFNHAHLATNANGEVGLSVGAGGGESHATPVAGFVGDPTLYVTGMSNTSLDRYGDYTAIRPHWPNTKLFSVSDYYLVAPASGEGFTVHHQYRLFGRSGDEN